jgi:hypothetical protein
LLAGISSAGKSRFAIPALIMHKAGLPVLGLASHPEPWCLVSRDRTLLEVQESIVSLGFNPEDVPIVPAFGAHSKSFNLIMQDIEKLGVKLVFWEGIDMMVRNPNNPFEVGEFLSSLTAYCEKGLTVLGSTGVAKLKPNETYQNPRQLVSGSTIWERCTGTNFVIVPIAPKDIEDGRRLLYASVKNESSFAVVGEFGERGVLTFDSYAQRDIGAQIANASEKERAHLWGSLR